MNSKIYLFIFLYCLFKNVAVESAFELSLIHLNDLHDRIEESNVNSAMCSNGDCISGISRIYTAVNQLIKSRPNPIVLNAGDNFQGTVWYSFFKWNATQHFLNFIPTDAYTIGNHEFDDGVEGLVPFLKALNAPIVVCNIDDSKVPELQGLYNKSIVIERGGKRIGIIGVITSRTGEISYIGNVSFFDEVESVNAEAVRLDTEENVDTIVVVSHCGYFKDKILAQRAAPKISVIVGGHSHVLLYNGIPPGIDRQVGPYPTVIEHEDGRKVLVVQASSYGKYLGNITVQYDEDGNVTSWDGTPIYLNSNIPQNEFINSEVQVWKNIMKSKIQTNVIGETKVFLNSKCLKSECNIGNMVTDAMVNSHLNTSEKNAWTFAAIAVVNGGSIRISLQQGNITSDDLKMLIPFQNTMDVVQIKGKYLKELLEFGAGHHNNTSSLKINLLQVSGIHVTYNLSNPIGSRVRNLKLRCRECDVPIYEPLNENYYYRVVMNSFMVDGKGGYEKFKPHMEVIKIGDLDINVMTNYIKKYSPLIPEIQGRMKVLW